MVSVWQTQFLLWVIGVLDPNHFPHIMGASIWVKLEPSEKICSMKKGSRDGLDILTCWSTLDGKKS